MREITFEDDAAETIRYDEVLRVPALSVGRYVLPAGSVDPQQPHTEDEIYLVRSGRGILRTPTGEAAAVPGAVLFVPAGEEHRFVDIEEPLDVIVVFGPAEYTKKEKHG
ncbi:cupin domain-containing protein [Microbacterium kunmingense]|uniref:cupin domain-containing protein n=1 Tax=Microbacterium kunmingense TaxID=2915939 RepID=UPI00200596C6|nr:cupin domain-containing protein [Microbacterium kunmingense]